MSHGNGHKFSDGTEIFYKDWGTGQPYRVQPTAGLCLPMTGTPKCSSFLHHGYRVIAHDRRGNGRSAQVSEGQATWTTTPMTWPKPTRHLDLHDAIHVGHSQGGWRGGAWTFGRHGEERVAKVVLISAPSRPRFYKPMPIRPARPKLLSRACKLSSQRTARSSTEPYRPARSTNSRPAGRRSLRSGDCELVAPRHDGQRDGPLRKHYRVHPRGLHG